jgi:hypothetical protein
MFAIACSLKKGLHLNMIHNLDRPFNELMLGLESFIPIYMTGQISPYYFESPTANLFNHTLYCSEVCALSGEDQRHYDPDNNSNEDLDAQDLKKQFELIPADKKINARDEKNCSNKDNGCCCLG